MKYRIVGTAGHIDHGKSALVRALTGTDPDRLQEERERGITIDLGFAHLDLPGDIRVGFVDVPGHERFVKNMLAGIGGIDAVLLVIAADESIMPQTREHLAICELLGVASGVVAVTKCDTVDEELAELVELEVRELLAGTPLQDAPVVRTSARTGAGLDVLQSTLAEVLGDGTQRLPQNFVRLPVDRVFTVRGFGTVVTGTLLSGEVRAAAKLELLPSRTPVNVRGVQVYGEGVQAAAPGQRTAVNLQGIDTGSVSRGDLLVSPNSMATTYMIDARLQMLPEHELEQLQRVRFHHGAAEILCRVALLEGETIAKGDSALVQLRLESPYACAPGDRFVVRRYSPMLTIGGGVVIDNMPAKHRHRDEHAIAHLMELENAAPVDRLAGLTAQAGAAGVDETQLRHRMSLTGEQLRAILTSPGLEQRLVVAHRDPLVLVDANAVGALERATLAAISRHHDEQPLSPGLPKSSLASVMPRGVPEVVVDALIGRLVENGKIRSDGTALALTGHQLALSDDQRHTRDRILQLFEDAGLSPPSIAEVVTELGLDGEAADAVLHLLLRQGELVRVRQDLVFRASRLRALVEELRARYAPGESFSVPEFKDLAGVSRKHAIPLLEYLDQRRITRREGDRRVRI